MKDRITIPAYDFNVNNSGGSLERLMFDQRNRLPEHMLQQPHFGLFTNPIVRDYRYVIRTMKQLGIPKLIDPNNIYTNKFDIRVRNLVFSYYIKGVDISSQGTNKFNALAEIHNLKLLLERRKAFQEVKLDEDYESESFLDTYRPSY